MRVYRVQFLEFSCEALSKTVTVQTPVNFNNYKYPSERTIKIQTVNVTEDNNVVATIMLDVSTPSFFIFFAII